MKITTLGTGHGDPNRTRYNTSTLWETCGRHYLIDAGAPVQASMIRRGIDISNTLKGIFFTHMHEDHFGGLTGLLKHLTKYPPPEPVPVWMPEDAADIFRQLLAVTHRPLSDKAVTFHLTAPGHFFDDGFLSLSAIPTKHLENEGNSGYPSYAFEAQVEDLHLVHTGDLKYDFSDFPASACTPDTICFCELTHYPLECAMPVLKTLSLRQLVFTHIWDHWDTPEGRTQWKDAMATLDFPAEIAEDGSEFVWGNAQ